MLLNKEDIDIKQEGNYTVQTYLPTRTTIQYQWSKKTKQSDLPVQVIQRTEDGEIDEVVDFGSDEVQFWDAIAKFEEFILQERKKQGKEEEEEEPQGQNQSDSQDEQMEQDLEDSAKEEGMSDDDIQDLMDELDKLEEDADNADDSDDSDGDNGQDGQDGDDENGDGEGDEGDGEGGEKSEGEGDDDGDGDGDGEGEGEGEGDGEGGDGEGGEGEGEGEGEGKGQVAGKGEGAEELEPNEKTILEEFTETEESDLKYRYRKANNVIRELSSFSKEDYAERGIDKEEFINKTKEYIKKYF